MLSRILRDEDYEAIKYFYTNGLDQKTIELVEYIKSEKTFDIIEITQGLSVKHAGLFMEMINEAEREIIDEEINEHLNFLENEVFEKTEGKDWLKNIDGIFDMTIDEAFNEIENRERNGKTKNDKDNI